MPGNPQLSVDFREADLEAVFGYIHAGQSTEIIGVGSVGKSNFIRRMLRRDVQDRYLYQDYGEQSRCVFINLDANSLLEPIPSAMDARVPSGWPGYELMAARLLRTLMEIDLLGHVTSTNNPAHPEALYAMYHRLWPGQDNGNLNVVAFRYLEDLVQRIFVGANIPIRLIFIFDEFEKFLSELPPRFFQSLRSLRDQYKDRILYLTTARQIMPLLVPAGQHQAYEPFYELFSNSRHFLLPYRPSDTEQTFDRLAGRQDHAIPPLALREQLMAVTGGHAGLLRAAFAAWQPHELLDDRMSDAEVIATLLGLPAVQEECKTIWRSLSEGELQVLFDMVRAQQKATRTDIKPYHAMASLLVQKGILIQTASMGFENVRPAVFAAFLLTAIPLEAQDIRSIPAFPARPNIWK